MQMFWCCLGKRYKNSKQAIGEYIYDNHTEQWLMAYSIYTVDKGRWESILLKMPSKGAWENSINYRWTIYLSESRYFAESWILKEVNYNDINDIPANDPATSYDRRKFWNNGLFVLSQTVVLEEAEWDKSCLCLTVLTIACGTFWSFS